MRFFSVDQFQMQIATRLIRETLKEFARQSKPKCTRHVLLLFFCADAFELQFIQAAPHEVGAPAEIDDAPGETFVHGDVCLPRERIPRIEARAIAPNAFLFPQRLSKGLPKRQAAILDGVVGVNFEVTFAAQFQVYDRMSGEKRQHVVEKRDTGPNRRFALPIDLQLELNSGLFRRPLDFRLPLLHLAELTKPHLENKAQILFGRKLFLI